MMSSHEEQNSTFYRTMIHEKIDFDHELAQAQQDAIQSLKLLQENGFVVDTAEWLTVKRYAERYGLTTQVVTNWMARGIIPANCTMTLPELNNLRLVRNQAYRQLSALLVWAITALN